MAKAQAEQALGDFQKREQILNLLETGIIYTDQNGIVKYVNPEATRYLSADSQQHIGEHIDRLLYVFLDVDGKFPEPGLFQKMTDATFGSYTFGHQTLIVKLLLGNRTIRLNANPSRSNALVEAGLFEIHDVSNETKLSLRIEHSASHDSLTGLQNRRALEDRILRINKQYETASSLVYALIDIDNFKPINDIAGYLQGDQALIKLPRPFLVVFV